MKADLTPQFFESKGTALLEIEENTSITVQGKTAAVQDDGKSRANVDVANSFFMLSRYIPVTTEMMLVGYC